MRRACWGRCHQVVLHNAARVAAKTIQQVHYSPSTSENAQTALCSANGSGAVRASRLLLAKDAASWQGAVDSDMTSEMLENIAKLVQEIKKWARPPVNHFRSPVPFDKRTEALNVFASFLDDADMTGTGTGAGDHIVDQLAGDKRRIPIAVNSGTSGSGKTTQLKILCNEFSSLRPGGKFVYCTMNGENSIVCDCDVGSPIDVRVAHRIIHAAAYPPLHIDLQTLWKYVRQNLGMAKLGVDPTPMD